MSNSGPGAAFAAGAVVETTTCAFDGSPFDIAPGGEWTFIPGRAGGVALSPSLPVGATCQVHLTDDGGGEPTFTGLNVAPATLLNSHEYEVTINDDLTDPPVVEIDLAYALAALDVTVTNEGAGAAFANAPFAVEVECRLDGDPVIGFGTAGKVTIHFAPDGTLIPDPSSASLASLPVGAECTAVETDQGGATEWGTNPPGTTLESDGALLAITNVFLATQLSVTPQVAGNDIPADVEFVYDAECRFNDVLLPSSPTLPTTFALLPDSAQVLTLPVGAECVITETHDEHATSVAPNRVQSVTITGAPSALTFDEHVPRRRDHGAADREWCRRRHLRHGCRVHPRSALHLALGRRAGRAPRQRQGRAGRRWLLHRERGRASRRDVRRPMSRADLQPKSPCLSRSRSRSAANSCSRSTPATTSVS